MRRRRKKRRRARRLRREEVGGSVVNLSSPCLPCQLLPSRCSGQDEKKKTKKKKKKKKKKKTKTKRKSKQVRRCVSLSEKSVAASWLEQHLHETETEAGIEVGTETSPSRAIVVGLVENSEPLRQAPTPPMPPTQPMLTLLKLCSNESRSAQRPARLVLPSRTHFTLAQSLLMLLIFNTSCHNCNSTYSPRQSVAEEFNESSSKLSNELVNLASSAFVDYNLSRGGHSNYDDDDNKLFAHESRSRRPRLSLIGAVGANGASWTTITTTATAPLFNKDYDSERDEDDQLELDNLNDTGGDDDDINQEDRKKQSVTNCLGSNSNCLDLNSNSNSTVTRAQETQETNNRTVPIDPLGRGQFVQPMQYAHAATNTRRDKRKSLPDNVSKDHEREEQIRLRRQHQFGAPFIAQHNSSPSLLQVQLQRLHFAPPPPPPPQLWQQPERKRDRVHELRTRLSAMLGGGGGAKSRAQRPCSASESLVSRKNWPRKIIISNQKKLTQMSLVLVAVNRLAQSWQMFARLHVCRCRRSICFETFCRQSLKHKSGASSVCRRVF